MTNIKERSVYLNVLISGCASGTATIFSNPLEVAKTRIQLQGEMGSLVKPYNNVFDAFFKIIRKEGITAI